MNFAVLPPEITSARMYSGPGSAPMLAAAAAWDELAADLYSTAASYSSVISDLTGGGWSGPSSASMAAAAGSYVAWLTSTAGQAEQAGNQARTAAAAYQTAFAMTVPPPVIAANRTLLASLAATNFLGQNTPAIACTEAHYAEMWAQDIAAMYGYAGSSATAARLTPFTAPAPTTNAEGLAAQAAATAQGTGVHPQLLSAVAQALQSLGSPAATSSPSSVVSLLGTLAPYAGVLAGGIGTVGAGVGTGAGSVGLVDIALGIVGTAAQASVMAAGSGGAVGSTLVSAPGPGSGAGVLVGHSGAGATVSADLGKAGNVGALSVPPGWATATPTASRPAVTSAIRLTAEAIPTAMPAAMWSALPIGQLGRRRADDAAAPRFVAIRHDTGSTTASA
jgi:PPE-repeat protein